MDFKELPKEKMNEYVGDPERELMNYSSRGCPGDSGGPAEIKSGRKEKELNFGVVTHATYTERCSKRSWARETLGERSVPKVCI